MCLYEKLHWFGSGYGLESLRECGKWTSGLHRPFSLINVQKYNILRRWLYLGCRKEFSTCVRGRCPYSTGRNLGVYWFVAVIPVNKRWCWSNTDWIIAHFLLLKCEPESSRLFDFGSNRLYIPCRHHIHNRNNPTESRACHRLVASRPHVIWQKWTSIRKYCWVLEWRVVNNINPPVTDSFPDRKYGSKFVFTQISHNSQSPLEIVPDGDQTSAAFRNMSPKHFAKNRTNTHTHTRAHHNYHS